VLHYGHGGAPSVFEIAAAASVFAAGYTCIAASGFDCTMLHCRVCKVIMYTRLLLLFVSQATPASPHQVQTVPCFTTAMVVPPTIGRCWMVPHTYVSLLLLLLFVPQATCASLRQVLMAPCCSTAMMVLPTYASLLLLLFLPQTSPALLHRALTAPCCTGGCARFKVVMPAAAAAAATAAAAAVLFVFQATPALPHLAPTALCFTTAMAVPPTTSRCVMVTSCRCC
jgi:hypothetical protein